jgi:hypothetical protein
LPPDQKEAGSIRDGVTPEIFAALPDAVLPEIVSLQLIKFSADDAKTLAPKLGRLSKIRKLSFLASPNLGGVGAGAALIALSAHARSSLTELDLSHTGLRSADEKMLVNVLGLFTELNKIHLNGQDLGIRLMARLLNIFPPRLGEVVFDLPSGAAFDEAYKVLEGHFNRFTNFMLKIGKDSVTIRAGIPIVINRASDSDSAASAPITAASAAAAGAAVEVKSE